MELTDMKQTKKEQMGSPVDIKSDASDEPRYPHGLTLMLDDASLKKLGLKPPKVGSKVTVMGVGTVIRTTEHNWQDTQADKAEASRHVEIQLQRLGVEKGVPSMEEAVNQGIEEAD